jgi:hypothetical protein
MSFLFKVQSRYQLTAKSMKLKGVKLSHSWKKITMNYGFMPSTTGRP